MHDVVIKDFEHEDAVAMAENMRDMDRIEYQAMAQGAPILTGMEHMLKASRYAKAAYIDGKLLCCWGRIRQTILTNECCPWMVATTLIEERGPKRIFIERSPQIIADLTNGFSRSWNLVYEGNRQTIRWLKWAGFEFVGDPVMVSGLKFLPFEKRKLSDVR